MRLHFLAFALVVAAPAAAQPDLERAFALYQDAESEAAADLLVRVADDASRATPERRQALEMLGLIYVQQRRQAEARAAMEQILDLEPPLVSVDVDELHPELAGLYLEARRDRQGSYAVEADDRRLHTLAIADFSNNAVHRRDEFDPMTEGFALEMIRHLNGATDLRVVERARLDWLLRELELQSDRNLVDASTAVEVGRLLGASAVLLGNFVILNDELRLGVRFVSVETGEVIRTASVEGSPDQIFDAIEALSLEIAGAMQEHLGADLEVHPDRMGEMRDTESTEALLAYVEGRGFLERGDMVAAVGRFKRALEVDPGLERAQRQLDQIRPFVVSNE